MGNLVVGKGASITGDAQSRVVLTSDSDLYFAGQVHLVDGAVTLGIVPRQINDVGYIATQGIEIGATGTIDVSGGAIYTPNNAGLEEGSVLGGGSVTLNARRGSVTTDVGSLINISGTAAPFDVIAPHPNTPVAHEDVASAAGSVTVFAPEQISLLGTLEASAGHGSTGAVAGGTLSVTLSRLPELGFAYPGPVLGATFPTGPRTIELMPAAPLTVAAPGSARAILDPTRITASGFDALTLSADQVQLDAGTQLSLGREISLVTPSLIVGDGAHASLSAAYVAAGSGLTTYAPAVASAGTGALVLAGSEAVDLIGTLAISGAGSTLISTNGELGLRGQELKPPSVGALNVAGALTLDAADIVPATGRIPRSPQPAAGRTRSRCRARGRRRPPRRCRSVAM